MNESVMPDSGSCVHRSGTPVITHDEWIREFERVLREASGRNDEGLTAREIGAALGIGPKAMLEKLRRLGPRVVPGRRTIIDRAGRTNTTFCYRLRPERPEPCAACSENRDTPQASPGAGREE